MTTPLPVIADTYRCAITWVNNGQTAVNVMHFRQPGGGGTESDNCAHAINAHVTANMWAPMSGGSAATDIAITPLDGATATTHYSITTPALWVGTGGADFVPAAAVLIKLTTALRGRNHRGRLYMPFIAESSMSDGSIPTGDAANLSTHWTDFQNNMHTNVPPFDLVVAAYDRAHDGAAAAATGVTHITGEVLLGSQRRRQSRLRGA